MGAGPGLAPFNVPQTVAWTGRLLTANSESLASYATYSSGRTAFYVSVSRKPESLYFAPGGFHDLVSVPPANSNVYVSPV